MKKTIYIIALVLFLGFNTVFANLELKNVFTDPAVIAAGDEVDIIIEYKAKDIPFEVDKIGDDQYSLDIKLKADDDVTKEYVEILDSKGNHIRGSVLNNIDYTKKFRIKVSPEAIPANYEFKLEGNWYREDEKIGSTISERFTIPVKKEGIVVDIASLETTPSRVKPGDNFVEVKTSIENLGFKDAKSLNVNLNTKNELIESSYSNNNRKWIGGIKTGEFKEASFYLDLDEKLKSGVHNLSFDLNYLDRDNNNYNKTVEIPLYVESRPYLRVENFSGSGLAGDNSRLEVEIKNYGEDDAESVDVRIIKQSLQPFAFDIRSSYVGEIKAGESEKAVFEFDTMSDAQIDKHQFKLLIRAKGDTQENDDSIYTFHDNASYDVTGKANNWYLIVGGILLVILIAIFITSKIFGGRKNES